MRVLSLGVTRKPCNLSQRHCRDGEVADGAEAPVWRRLLPPQPPGHRHGARRARAPCRLGERPRALPAPSARPGPTWLRSAAPSRKCRKTAQADVKLVGKIRKTGKADQKELILY